MNFAFLTLVRPDAKVAKFIARVRRERPAPARSRMRLAHEETADGGSGWKSADDCTLAEEWLDARAYFWPLASRSAAERRHAFAVGVSPRVAAM